MLSGYLDRYNMPAYRKSRQSLVMSVKRHTWYRDFPQDELEKGMLCMLRCAINVCGCQAMSGNEIRRVYRTVDSVLV
jgi:hypothetical protein